VEGFAAAAFITTPQLGHWSMIIPADSMQASNSQTRHA
jgi:hypothetical protein